MLAVDTTVGPVLPDVYAVAWIYAIIVPVVLVALGLLLLYFVIKRAVVSGIREARAAERASDAVRAE